MPLEKLTPSVHREEFPVVRMWRDDLDEISRLIKEDVDDEHGFEIRAYDGGDGYLVPKIADLSSFKVPRLTAVSMQATSIRFKLTIGPKAPRLEVEEPDLRTRGLVAEITRILKGKARPLARLDAWVRSHPGFLFGITAGFCVLGVILTLERGSEPEGIDWFIMMRGFGIGIAIGLMVAGIYRLTKLNRSILYAKTKVEAPTFWSRKKDDLVITLVSSVLSLLLGGVIGYWVNSIS